ncbi:hypothetical protein RchiOBHm_Chr2g0137491 [Rosa chinensis]|uniref:Uncharacterized protein n=1 Tax=Rosa chinensis TaxID=74649 RepID=A0A2P6RWM6_ROSCH|nr:hypothetical protein RchiOBHm_Chr2g0137491 [Rosa chinensis]
MNHRCSNLDSLEPETRELSGGVIEVVVLDHHMVEVLIVGDRDEGVEILIGELVLEADSGVRESDWVGDLEFGCGFCMM